MKKPHIIIFNPDEMRWDALAHLGNPAAVTPHFDALAREEGVSFSSAFCQNPVCVPSRCSFFTGLYPHVHGHRTMAHLLRPGESSLFSELQEEGYYIWSNDRNDLYAAQYAGWMEGHADEIFYGGEVPPPPGPIDATIRGKSGDKHFYSHYHGQLATDERGVNYTKDDEVVDALIHRMLHPVDQRPICAFAGLLYPHTPYQVEEPYYSAIDRSKLPPRVRAADCIGKPRMEAVLRQYQAMDTYTEDDWNELRAVYLGMCMKVDQQFGRLCAALKQAEIYDDCAIFVLSDHGDFAGDYDIAEKAQNCLEDCLVRVPLLVKPPKGYAVDAGVSDALVELVDFYATVAELAGVKSKRTHFGKSLLPLLADRTLQHRDYVFSEGGRMPEEEHCTEFYSNGPNGSPKDFVYWPRQTAQTDDLAHSKATMVRDTQYKYIRRASGEDEFYNLQSDPAEQYNEIENPQYAAEILRLKDAMLAWYQSTCDVVPHDYDSRMTPEMLWNMMKDRVPAERATEVKAMLQNGGTPGMVARLLQQGEDCHE